MNTSIDLKRYINVVRTAAAPSREGRLLNVIGLVIEAGGCRASIGDMYEIRSLSGGETVEAEVVGLRGDRTLLMPLGAVHGLEVGSPLRRLGQAAQVKVGRALLGRVVNGLGRPIDGLPAPELEFERPLYGTFANALMRKPIDTPFWVGIRTIDGLLTMGRGQRIGIFAGGGVGKSTLLGMMVRRASADVAVVALIGERAREVEDFVHRILGTEGMARSIVVVATSADPPLVRARGALYASTIAEYFRANGLSVLLVMDSLTRYAMALREIGLAIGEPPTTKGYTPSVFASLPRLVERAGTCAGSGAITGVYTVLVEGDDLSEPIADAARATLDGQIALSRRLAERGHFPSIDLPRSISRVMPQITTSKHRAFAQKARELLASYGEAEDLVSIGAYKKGSLSRLDEALALMPRLEGFLRQDFEEKADPSKTLFTLERIWSEGAKA
jgi:flagellum-specific ATP synthase